MRGSQRSNSFSLISLLVLGVLAVTSASCSAQAPSSLSPASPNAAAISNLFYIIFGIAVAVFVIVESLLLYSVIRFQRKSDDEMPKQVHGNVKLEIAWTLAPALVLAVVFGITFQTINSLAEFPKDSLKIKVTGHQWWWQVEYPDLGIVTANEIHLPLDQAASFTVESKDVIHSFWVPELGGKIDMIPGKKNQTWFRPFKLGTFHGQCAEFCGMAHANMRFTVIVERADQFNAWVGKQQVAAAAPQTDLAKRGQQEFLQGACVACHTVSGTNAKGTIGPDLTHIASRQTFAGSTMEMNTDNLRAWLQDPQTIKPGNLMPNLKLSADQINALIAYLEALK